MLAIKTFRLVNTENLTAFLAFPPFFFVSNEMPYAEFSYALEIADHAHAVLGSIPLIQIFQPGAREAVTAEAVLDFGERSLLAVFNFARDAVFRLEAVVASTIGAWFFLPCECTAQAAIHSAGGDQFGGNGRHIKIQQKLCERIMSLNPARWSAAGLSIIRLFLPGSETIQAFECSALMHHAF
jgi:hypothetical protein